MTSLSPLGLSIEETQSPLSSQSPSAANCTTTGYSQQNGSASSGPSTGENNVPRKLSEDSIANVDRQTKAGMEDANLKAIWDEEMKDFEPTGKPHRTTAVLMISWAEEASDLNTTKEVDELETIFRDVFNYEVIKREINGGPRAMLPGVQVTKHLIELVEKYDRDSTLLIIYYAGHGFPGKSGGLQLAG